MAICCFFPSSYFPSQRYFINDKTRAESRKNMWGDKNNNIQNLVFLVTWKICSKWWATNKHIYVNKDHFCPPANLCCTRQALLLLIKQRLQSTELPARLFSWWVPAMDHLLQQDCRTLPKASWWTVLSRSRLWWALMQAVARTPAFLLMFKIQWCVYWRVTSAKKDGVNRDIVKADTYSLLMKEFSPR